MLPSQTCSGTLHALAEKSEEEGEDTHGEVRHDDTEHLNVRPCRDTDANGDDDDYDDDDDDADHGYDDGHDDDHYHDGGDDDDGGGGDGDNHETTNGEGLPACTVQTQFLTGSGTDSSCLCEAGCAPRA